MRPVSPPPRMTRRAVARSGAATLGAAVVAWGLARWLLPGRPAAPPPPWATRPGLPNARLAAGGAARIEPSVAADPADPAHLIAAFRSFQRDRIGIATAVSADGGRNCGTTACYPASSRTWTATPSSRSTTRGTALWRASRPRPGRPGTEPRGSGAPRTAAAVSAPRSRPSRRAKVSPIIPAWPLTRATRACLYLTAVLAGGPRSGLVFCRSADGGVSFEPRAGSARPAAPAPWHRSSPPGQPGRSA